ncbi:N-acetylmuramoyl-L-alanine amidase [Agrobacterium sp. a22-2]|uniref:N-acetylmuramoyl-L-alanine amidase n=1 Tax=Agrobacterium sp. a22-2 TaxID=2283840 RepID=UPI001445F644|nr:N-acetylmuramoyl-L-alanine amidase [Agrobacterium sp. a22-2]NKN36193.1 N-acetylmuramoyl-L-alanine amidase [Agrobacterium sp. a22-2]
MISFKADYPGARVVPSPNFGERAGGIAADMIILHYTGMESDEGALAWLCNAESQVSSHYFVHQDGTVVQMVPEAHRAWHAGKSQWAGESDINSRSIGIEIANGGHPAGLPAFPDAQVDAVVELCRDCVERRGIAPERVLGHSDIAPGRKVDPGEMFPWGKLHRAGVGHWVEPVAVSGGRYFQRGDCGQPVEALQSMLSLYGYGIDITGEFSEKTEAVVKAFQLHFRPQQVDGIADMSTIETLHRLLSSLPRFG